MEREIKFKVWSEESKNWAEQPYVECNLFRLHPWEKLVQFTGLKDKNGKEIYEGDLIKCSYCKEEYGEVVFVKNSARFDIKWSDKDCGNSRHTDLGVWGELSGNIYENKDLLTNN